MRFPCLELDILQLCWSEEKLNHVLKVDGDKLFKDLLANIIFSRHVLSWNFKMKLFEQRTGMETPWLEINSDSLFL